MLYLATVVNVVAANGVDKVSQVGQNSTNQFGTWGIIIAVLGCVIAGITMVFNAEKGKKLLIGSIIALIVIILATSGDIEKIVRQWVGANPLQFIKLWQ